MNFPFKIATKREFDAVGFGLNTVDRLIVVPEYPTFDTKVRLLEHQQTVGGEAANTMLALKRLGLTTAYAGCFGSDEDGRFVVQTLDAEGVNLEFTEVVEGARNHLAFIIVDARNGERTILWNRDERLAYRLDEVPISLASRGRVLHLDGQDPLAGARMAQVAREHGTIVSARIDKIHGGLSELLPLIEMLVTSPELSRELTGIDDERAALIEMKARYGCGVVGMTLGKRGPILYCQGDFIESPAYDAADGCPDTIGHGDSFCARLLYGLLTGKEVETSLQLANAPAF